MSGALTASTALATLLAAVLGVLKYFNYRTRRDKQAMVGQAFSEVVRGLGETEPVARITSAILVRRFFDPTSEYSVAGSPYAADAVRVIAAVLRQEATGGVQKLLADGLAFAPSLVHTDLQRANLRDAYLSRDVHPGPVDVTDADLYRADLSGASLRGTVAVRTAFYEARLVGTVFTGAILRDASFVGADLLGARFDGAVLTGANFTGSLNVPTSIEAHLDAGRRYPGTDPVGLVAAIEGDAATSKPLVFLSTPSVLRPQHQAVLELVVGALEREGVDIERVTRTDYSASSPLSDVHAAMRRCSGVVVLGLPQLVVAEGSWRTGTDEQASVNALHLSTPWSHIETGMAAGLGLPTLIVQADCSSVGVFDLPLDGDRLVRFDFGDTWNQATLRQTVRRWTRQLHEANANTGLSAL